MPLVRNQFVPQYMLQIFTSAAAMTDLRTGAPYLAGGLVKGSYYDLTEMEAQQQAPSLHSGRYRFVQLDPAAVVANVGVGKIGAMKALAQGLSFGVNFITDFSQNIGGATGLPRGVVFINSPTAAQILAGCWLFVQELGDASVSMSAAVAVGLDVFVGAGGQAAGSTTAANSLLVGQTIQAATAAGQLARCILQLPIVQD